MARRFFLLYTLLFFSQIAIGQRYTANIENFGMEAGLSHTDAREVALDARGLVWVGTRKGLNRFDGKKFKSFFKEDGLLDDNIESLFSDGEMLICVHKSRTTEAINAITIFHSVTEKPIPFAEWSGLPDVKMSDVVKIDGNSEELVFWTEPKNGKEPAFYLKKIGQAAVKFTLDVPATLIGSCRDGTFWFHEFNDNKITKRDFSGRILRTVSTKFLKTWPAQFYVDMRFDEHEEWLFAYDSLYQIKGDRLRHKKALWGMTHHKNKLVELPSEFVRKHDYTGLLWYSLHSTNYLIDSSGAIKFTHHNKNQYVNNADKFIENIILQPTSEGLTIISLYPSRFQNFSQSAKGAYRGVTRLGDDYVICNELGVQILDRKFNKITKFISYVGNSAFNHKGSVYTIGRQTVNEINQNQELKSTLHLPFAHEVWGTYIEDSYMYYSTFGLHQIDRKTGKSQLITSQKFPEINEATIYSIQPKSMNELWLCTTEGLFIWSKETKLFDKISIDIKDFSDFQHLYQNDNILWLASGGNGLIKYNISTKIFQVYDLGHQGTNIVHSVYPDERGYLWLSTDYGIVKFNPQTEEHRIFKESDGLVNNEFNRISHFQDVDGTLVFGGVKGLVRFHPDSLIDITAKIPTLRPMVADVWLYKKGSELLSQVTAEFNNENTITIQPRDRFLSFDLATNSIEHYDKVIFSYRMNDEEDWKTLPSNRLEFNVFPFGEHNITIQAALPNGYVSDHRLKFKVIALRPIYLRWWFLTCIIISLIATSAFAVVIRTNRFQTQKTLLENEVSKRTLELIKDKEVIEKQAQELQSLDKMKNRFFANISHELRNPLTLILGPVENLLQQKEIGIPTTVRSQMNLTLKNAKNLQKRINEILALSKIDAGKLNLSLSTVKAHSFFSRVIKSYESYAMSKDIVLNITISLPDNLHLSIDPDNTEKVINNLISNAIKHSPKETEIIISLLQMEKDKFALTVEDQGGGIKLSEQQKIFDRYYQSKKGEMAGGTGLGLALSLELAKIMKGNIQVTSNEGEGAKFTFTFQAETSEKNVELPTEVETLETSQNTPYVVEINPTISKHSVLVVDDNEEMRAYIKSIFGHRYKVYEAEHGRAALELLEKRKIDLITSDLMMPEMDGMQFLAHHKASSSYDIPVIMVTARADDNDKLKALEIGVDDYITKPFYARELMARVQNLLQNRKLRQEAILDVHSDDPIATDIELHMQKVLDVIKQNLSNNAFSIGDLADEMGYSERQLRRIIKKEKGITPTALLKEVRLNLARSYFETEQLATVSEVMFACGFKSPGHFAKGYFERFGKKPNEYFE